MISFLKRIAAALPIPLQLEIKRYYYLAQIRSGTFATKEPEFFILEKFIKHGDWVIDIGANIGHYTIRFSKLVGDKGRVIAFEPVPDTFKLLTLNVRAIGKSNVTLINTAVSSRTNLFNMSIPCFETGLIAYPQARLIDAQEGNTQILAINLDGLNISERISLIKIDVEGHEEQVLSGMQSILHRDKPTMIIETDNQSIIKSLESMGYSYSRMAESPNILFVFDEEKSPDDA